jgi:tryptophan 2-monooxygenase
MEYFYPKSVIDVLFEYEPLLKKDKLALLPPGAKHKSVAIIGAGAAGICAGYELLKMGLIPTIYEVNNRIGGRVYTKKFDLDRDTNLPYAELGAMRVPSTSYIFYHYARLLKLTLFNNFPNPGEVDTLIQHENKTTFWKAKQPFPREFQDLNMLTRHFLFPLRDQLFNAWEGGDTETVIRIWQYYLDKYANKSFFEVLNEDSPLAGKEELMRLFGTVGLGHGGFNSLYSIGFMEFLRLIVNCSTQNEITVKGGMITFLEKLIEEDIQNEEGCCSLKTANCIQLNKAILSIDYNSITKNPLLRIRNEITKEVIEKEYDAVIYTGTTCSAHLLNFTNTTTNGVYLFSNEVRRAIRDSYMVSSSKTFILTKDKFWKKNKLPRCFITDELIKASYFIDLPGIEEGVICLSYTWGMDSIKLMAVDPQDLLIIFLRTFAKADPNIVKHLLPLNNQVININWVKEKYQNGAFKLLPPGYDKLQEALYFQFQSVLTPEDKGVYLAGDGISWQGGWIEGALTTALNSVFAVAKRFNAELVHPNPIDNSVKYFKY